MAIAAFHDFAAAAGSPDMRSVRSVEGGLVRGTASDNGGLLFRGLPFAAPPVGELRWRAPAPVQPWTGVRDAVRAGPPCKQYDYGWNAADAAASSEDCLYLDVHVPKHAPGEKLPVMFWIHGGANRAGSGIGYATSSIVEHGVVLVTLQYRLGVFGFLSHPALSAESAQGVSGNYAILDQIAALKWVRANIGAFDGDPDNVTIFGQSAGAQDVGLLMISPLARGLFHKAIEQSGTAGFGLPPRTRAQNERIGQELAMKVKAPDIAALRAVPADALLAAGETLHPPIEDAGFIWDQVTVDGYVIPRAPADILHDGTQARVPLIVGNNARELPLYGGSANVRHVVSVMFADKAAQALKFYRLDGTGDPPDDPVTGSIATQVANDVMFAGPAGFVADRQSAVGQRVWRYRLDVAKFGSPDPVWHSSDLSFVFDRKPAGLGEDVWPPMQAYWANFAKTGDPNGAGLIPWPEYGAERNFLAFSAAGPKPGKDWRGPIVRLLDRP